MKYTAIAALALAAVASAQQIQINDPTPSTVWKAGQLGYIRWTGTCADLGAAGKAVKVDIINGPFDSVHFVVELGTIDCTNAQNNSAQLPVPKEVQGAPLETGKYALRINLPVQQYSPNFTISNGDATPSAPSGNPTAPTSNPTPNQPSAANTLIAGSAMALAGAAAVALQFLF
ncbi:hypothetical protein BGW39_011394 [Mortierella sp. 14UC]|nr:hypothetical protein BGW39_011394 [Mortierella sp. 14UC]